MTHSTLQPGEPPRATPDANAQLAECVITPPMLPLLDQLMGVGCVLRDDAMRLVWCNDAFARLSTSSRERLRGTTIADHLPRPAAREREELLAEVIRTGRHAAFYQFGADKRLLCRAFPIDADAFGHRGVMVMVQEAPLGSALESGEALPVLTTPCLDDLDALSPSELRALYYLAQGLSTADIAQRLHRAAKTVEKHIESIHRKLGTSSRAELVRLSTERGLQAFTEDQWETIIEGARAVRRGRD